MARARLAAPARLLAVALLLLFIWWVALPAATRPTHGFSAYYTAARLVLEGQDPARFYDDDWFREQTVRLGFAGAEDIYNVNPPTAALLLLPLAGLTPQVARAIWTGLNLLCLGLALAGLLRLTCGDALASVGVLGGARDLPPAGRTARRRRVGQDALTAGGLALLVLFQPAREEVRLGQAYALLLLGEVALLWAYLARRERTAGLLLGLLLGVKTAGLLCRRSCSRGGAGGRSAGRCWRWRW